MPSIPVPVPVPVYFRGLFVFHNFTESYSNVGLGLVHMFNGHPKYQNCLLFQYGNSTIAFGGMYVICIIQYTKVYRVKNEINNLTKS